MKIVNIADLKQVARNKIPSDMWDFIEGAVFDEITKQRNEDKFREITLNPNFLIDVSDRELSTTILGEKIAFPIMIAPAGGKRQLHPDGELAAAKGAGSSGTSIRAPYRVWLQHRGGRRSRATGPLWFQLYHSDDKITEYLVDKAKRSGYSAICLTVDGPTSAPKERDLRNNFKRKPELYSGNFKDMPEFMRRTDIIPPDFADWSQ
jgi:4-hydroxymandelate oxidase